MTSVAFCFPLSQAEARTGESNAFDGEQEEKAEEGIKVVGIECFVIRNALHYEKCGIFSEYQWVPINSFHSLLSQNASETPIKVMPCRL